MQRKRLRDIVPGDILLDGPEGTRLVKYISFDDNGQHVRISFLHLVGQPHAPADVIVEQANAMDYEVHVQALADLSPDDRHRLETMAKHVLGEVALAMAGITSTEKKAHVYIRAYQRNGMFGIDFTRKFEMSSDLPAVNLGEAMAEVLQEVWKQGVDPTSVILYTTFG